MQMIHLTEKSIINNRAHFIDERRNEFNREYMKAFFLLFILHEGDLHVE